MRPGDRTRAQHFESRLRSFERKTHQLPGIDNPAYRNAFLEQLIESIRRIEYITAISQRDISANRADPTNEIFDPIRAAIWHKRKGHVDEAFWQVFLSVHFGKHLRSGWRLVRDVYGQFQGPERWDWERTSENPAAFRGWLRRNQKAFTADGITRAFGNHRKYETLKDSSARSTGAVFESYVEWIGPNKSHKKRFQSAQAESGNDPQKAFDLLFDSMGSVLSFGRTARFDYLTMVGKIGLSSIKPGSIYLDGATGPLTGARLLFGGSATAELSRKELNGLAVELGAHLVVGMQVIEDALCNWQKTPAKFVRFRG